MSLSYWKHKEVDLKALIIERGIELENLETANRKEIITALEVYDTKNGTSSKVLELNEEGIACNPDGSIKTVKVIFNNTGENDMPYLFIGHNGRGWYLPKEKEIFIPEFLLKSCIQDAVEVHEEAYRTPSGQMAYREKRIHRFPYTIIN